MYAIYPPKRSQVNQLPMLLAWVISYAIRIGRPGDSHPVTKDHFVTATSPVVQSVRGRQWLANAPGSDSEWTDATEEGSRSRTAREIEGPTHPQGRPRKRDHLLSSEDLRTRANPQKIARALGKEECVLASALAKGTPSALQTATLEQLTEMSNAAGNAILKVADTSGNLPGPFIRKLKECRRVTEDPSIAALRSQPRDAKSVIELLREKLTEKTARLARVTEGIKETAPAQLEIEEIVRRVDESMTAREEAIMQPAARRETTGGVPGEVTRK
ncbi:hypothetical protein RUM43_008411 [Polyplax serrata]|uniref:Uncharacterized protein n=1 Tax=Polyplax serrata TaxID=468196 RepID=A0AAN8P332_POLSC